MFRPPALHQQHLVIFRDDDAYPNLWSLQHLCISFLPMVLHGDRNLPVLIFSRSALRLSPPKW